jgi:predicted nucleotidyltransferase component of viral defense system
VNEVGIAAWVGQAPNGQRNFREVVHVILESIGRSQSLQTKMVMKGGLLMAIRYESSRYTRDLDFSTTTPYAAAVAQELVDELEQQIAVTADRLSYGTICRLQSSKVQPKGEGKTHQSLALKIGYADRGHPGQLARLAAKNSPHVVEIDYSYNEAVFDVEVVQLDGGATIQAYSLHNVIAEKLRSLLQQPMRRRNRRQDVYDICLLLDSVAAMGPDELENIHAMLVPSCLSKDIEPARHSMENAAVVQMAREGYDDLKADVEGDFPPFDEAMVRVQALYRSLPWA